MIFWKLRQERIIKREWPVVSNTKLVNSDKYPLDLSTKRLLIALKISTSVKK